LLASRRWTLPVALASVALAALGLGVAGAALGMLLHEVAGNAFAGVATEVALLGMAALPPALLVMYFIQIAIASERYEAALAIGVTTAIAYVAAVAALGTAFDLGGAVAGLLVGQVAAQQWLQSGGDEWVAAGRRAPGDCGRRSPSGSSSMPRPLPRS
jgi:hypothetical protein